MRYGGCQVRMASQSRGPLEISRIAKSIAAPGMGSAFSQLARAKPEKEPRKGELAKIPNRNLPCGVANESNFGRNFPARVPIFYGASTGGSDSRIGRNIVAITHAHVALTNV